MDTTILNPRQFITGGKAEFTIKNTNTGNKFEYKIVKKNDLFFINVRPDAHKRWLYAGFLNKDLNFIQGKKGCLTKNTPEVKGILYAIKFTNTLPLPMTMHHHGRCACCGKKLTDEESVRLGIGPTCRKYYLREA